MTERSDSRLRGYARGAIADTLSSLPPIDEAADFDWVGEVGSYYFTREADWIKRHVESIEIVDERLLRRKLTIDLDLPVDPAAVVQTSGSEAVFWMPVALLAKNPPTSNINLLDENGLTVPLLTRFENAVVSAIALDAALEEVLDDVPEALASPIPDIVLADKSRANIAMGFFDAAADGEDPRLKDHEQSTRLLRVAEELAHSSMVWMRLQGALGQRRVVQFGYDLAISPPRIFTFRQPRRQEYELGAEGERQSVPTSADEPTRGARTITGRMTARLATNFGWSAVDLYVDKPHIREADSYHLQVITPPGLEMRGLELLADVRDPETDEELELEPQINPSQGHLYFHDAVIRRDGPALVSVRAGRLGFLTLSTLTAAIIAALLVAFWADKSAISGDTDRQVAAGVALVVPALLAAFAVRPGEHLLTTRLLSGVRFLVLLAALASVTAAASLANIQPRGFDPDRQRTFQICAGVALTSTALLGVSLLTSLEFYFRQSRRFRAWRLAVTVPVTVYRPLLIGATTAVFFALLFVGAPGEEEFLGRALRGTALLMVAAGMASLSALRLSVPQKLAPLWVATGMASWVIYLIAAACTFTGLLDWSDVQTLVLTPGALLLVAGLDPAETEVS